RRTVLTDDGREALLVRIIGPLGGDVIAKHLLAEAPRAVHVRQAPVGLAGRAVSHGEYMAVGIVLLGHDEWGRAGRRRIGDRLDAAEIVIPQLGLPQITLAVDGKRDRLELPEAGVRVR